MLADALIEHLKEQAIRCVDRAAKHDTVAVMKIDAMIVLNLLSMLQHLREQVRK